MVIKMYVSFQLSLIRQARAITLLVLEFEYTFARYDGGLPT